MILLLASFLLAVSTDSFRGFAKSGHKAVCIVNYKAKTIKCDYETMNECREQYISNVASMCFLRKNLKLKGD